VHSLNAGHLYRLRNLYSKTCSTEQRHTTQSCEQPGAAAMAYSTNARAMNSFPVGRLFEVPPWLPLNGRNRRLPHTGRSRLQPGPSKPPLPACRAKVQVTDRRSKLVRWRARLLIPHT
jgi:hypothetical protein